MKTDEPMNETLEAQQAHLMLRLLLEDPRADVDELDWDFARRLATRDRVLIRLAERIETGDTPLPPTFAAAVARARAAAAATLEIVQRLDAACASCGAEYVVLKLAHQLPDTGSDVDLLVSGSAADIDRAVLEHVPAITGRRQPVGRITRQLRYVTARHGVVVDVHHGRVGPLGEDRKFAALLLRQRRRVEIGTGSIWAPSPEDQLLVQAMQVANRRSLRLGDLAWTIGVARDGRLAWARVLSTAKALGLTSRLSCYLDYVSQVHRLVFGHPLLPADVRGRLELGRWGQITFREGAFRFPAGLAMRRVWLDEMPGRVGIGDLGGAGRMLLLPVAAAAQRLRSLGRRSRPVEGAGA